MNKICEERKILELAQPLLEQLYGEFEVDPNQLDRPDAAIVLKRDATENEFEKKAIRIGIEITSIDKQEDQQYINEEKFASKVTKDQLDNLLRDNTYSKQPNKKLSIPFPNNYLSEGVIKKQDKYSAYLQAGRYDEMIILAFSSYLLMNYKYFMDYHRPSANYFLHEQRFPFDKVIFVCQATKKSVLVYDKSHPKPKQPQLDPHKEAGITVTHGPILPFNQKIPLFEILEKEPSISKPKKNGKPRKK